MKATEALAMIEREINRQDIVTSVHEHFVLEEVRRIVREAKTDSAQPKARS